MLLIMKMDDDGTEKVRKSHDHSGRKAQARLISINCHFSRVTLK
jgi:hypothetical protein